MQVHQLRTYVCFGVCIYVCMCVYLCMYVCIYVCMYVVATCIGTPRRTAPPSVRRSKAGLIARFVSLPYDHTSSPRDDSIAKLLRYY